MLQEPGSKWSRLRYPPQACPCYSGHLTAWTGWNWYRIFTTYTWGSLAVGGHLPLTVQWASLGLLQNRTWRHARQASNGHLVPVEYALPWSLKYCKSQAGSNSAGQPAKSCRITFHRDSNTGKGQTISALVYWLNTYIAPRWGKGSIAKVLALEAKGPLSSDP